MESSPTKCTPQTTVEKKFVNLHSKLPRYAIFNRPRTGSPQTCQTDARRYQPDQARGKKWHFQPEAVSLLRQRHLAGCANSKKCAENQPGKCSIRVENYGRRCPGQVGSRGSCFRRWGSVFRRVFGSQSGTPSFCVRRERGGGTEEEDDAVVGTVLKEVEEKKNQVFPFLFCRTKLTKHGCQH